MNLTPILLPPLLILNLSLVLFVFIVPYLEGRVGRIRLMKALRKTSGSRQKMA